MERAVVKRIKHNESPKRVITKRNISPTKMVLSTKYRGCYMDRLQVYDQSGENFLGLWHCDNTEGTCRFRNYEWGPLKTRMCNRCWSVLTKVAPASAEKAHQPGWSPHSPKLWVPDPDFLLYAYA